MTNNKYFSCEVVGGGKVFLKDTKDGKNFKIIEMSAEEIKIQTDLNLELDSIVHLKIILNSIIFDIDIDARGKVVEKLDTIKKYRIELIGLSDKVKGEIDEIIQGACNLI